MVITTTIAAETGWGVHIWHTPNFFAKNEKFVLTKQKKSDTIAMVSKD